MEWLQGVNRALKFIEDHLESDIGVAEVADSAYASASHFQRIFWLLTGVSIGEYIRNRRLSQAGLDLCRQDAKVIDVALKYQYDTPESFSKAFRRFHGVNSSEAKVRSQRLRHYYPLTIDIAIHGGFEMTNKLTDSFCWGSIGEMENGKRQARERYQVVTEWAGRARGQNPGVFDKLTEWVLDDSEWSEDKLAGNEQLLMHGVLARFKEQNARLRAYLKELEPSGVVNEAIFDKLNKFDEELSGHTGDEKLRDAVEKMFSDFSVMRDRGIRELIAGNKTGDTGTDSVTLFGYINWLKDCDAAVQWALFMPEVVKRQQQGFIVDSFAVRSEPAMRLIGFEGPEYEDVEKRLSKMRQLDALAAYQSDMPYDVLFMHHNGLGVDVGPWHGVWGRFMRADAPVPDGFFAIDLIPKENDQPGAPYVSQFAYATFIGDSEAMHRREGYDSDAMYDVTRNIMLGQGICIPYPNKYWTAEVFPDGCDRDSSAYMFSALQ